MTYQPVVALVVDRPDWAFANHAKALTKHLAGDFQIRTVPVQVVSELWRVPMVTAAADLTFYFWRGFLRDMQTPQFEAEVRRELGDYPEYARRYLSGRVATQICDHLFLDDEEMAQFAPVLTECVNYSTLSQRLYDVYSDHAGYPDPWGVLPVGVDLDLYSPTTQRAVGSALVVGWSGNSLWNGAGDTKGLRSILEPAIAALRSAGVDVAAAFQDRAVSQILSRERMPDYYRGLDVFVCASSSEGTPNTVLEAMACGLPVVSTDVGVVREVFGPLQRQFILPERTVGAMQEALATLANDPDLRAALREENLRQIRGRDWSLVASQWRDFFADCLE